MGAIQDELVNLQKRHAETENHLADLDRDFWRNGGICCPHCGVRGYSDLTDKQDRREARIRQLSAKLGDGAHKRKHDRLEAELKNIRRAIAYTAYLMGNSKDPERYFSVQRRRHELATDIERKLGYMPTHDSPTQVCDSGLSVSEGIRRALKQVA